MKDKRGIAYATVKDTKAGDVLFSDGGFTCMKENATHVVTIDKETGGLFLHCRDGKHFLEGQLSEDGTHYVGLYPQFAR